MRKQNSYNKLQSTRKMQSTKKKKKLYILYSKVVNIYCYLIKYKAKKTLINILHHK